jgi:hypothetical protein
VATWLVQEKIRASRSTLTTFPESPGRELAMHKLDGSLRQLRWSPATIEAVRLIEAQAALAYFTFWQSLPLRWKGTSKRPIPPAWERVGYRSSESGTNRHATHPVNAMLNYAYGVLESQVRMAAVAAGLDPAIGYLHACRPGRDALVYDLMEPFRPRVDRLVLGFICSHVFAPGDIIQAANGVCRLHPQLAKQVVGMTVADDIVQETVAEVAVQAARLPALRNETVQFGGPEALTQLEVVAIYERLLGRTIETEDMPRGEIEAALDGASTPTVESLAGVLLEATEPSGSAWPRFEDTLSIRRTSVADFAAAHIDLKGNR